MKLAYPSILSQYWHDLWVYKRATAQRTRTSYEQNSTKPTLHHLRRVLRAAPLSHASLPEDEGNHPLTPQMIVLKIAKLQSLIKQRATSSISKHYTPADSRTPLLSSSTEDMSPIILLGFLEINNFEFFQSTILPYVQTRTCAWKLAPPRRLVSNFYSNTTPNAAEQSVLLTLTRKSSGDHLSLQTTSFSFRHQHFSVQQLMQKWLNFCVEFLDFTARGVIKSRASWHKSARSRRSRFSSCSESPNVLGQAHLYLHGSPVDLDRIRCILMSSSRARMSCCRPSSRDFPSTCSTETRASRVKSRCSWRKKSAMWVRDILHATSAGRALVNSKRPWWHGPRSFLAVADLRGSSACKLAVVPVEPC